MSAQTVDPAPHVSAFAPLKRRAFRWLWLGVLVSGIGVWAQTVGAQWLVVDDPNAPTILALVQTANALPMMLLALPAGVVSDAFDRRWLLLGVQVHLFVVAIALAVLTALDLMPPALLLAFTFALGAGLAVQIPTWQPLITELVPRAEIPAAARLDMVSVNVSRAIGPAIAGWIIATWGVPQAFVFNALCFVVLAAVVLAWRRPSPAADRPRERFGPAMRAGARYVRHDPGVRVIVARLALFVAPACALWALLPLIASRQLGLAANGYGLLFAALGVGAVVGALGLGQVRRHLSSNTVLAASALVYAVAFALLMVVPGLLPAIPLLVVAGFGWTAIASTLVSELQLMLPSWVRARSLAVYMMVFTGCQAVFAPVWGAVTQVAGLTTAVLVSALLVAVGTVAARALPVPEGADVDRTPKVYWSHDSLGFDPEPNEGVVQVVVEFDVPPEHQEEWLEAMRAMRASRLRSGAFRWELYRIAERPDHFVELFAVASWEEHQHQHDTRLTAEDQAIEARALGFSITPPVALHLLPPTLSAPPPASLAAAVETSVSGPTTGSMVVVSDRSPLRTERLLLRDFTPDDVDFVHEVHTHPGIARFIPEQVSSDLAQARRQTDRFRSLVDDPLFGYWCVTLHDGTPVALVMLKPIPASAGVEDPRDIEIGWRQHPDHDGHGYATEAAAEILRHAFRNGVRRVVAVTDPANEASQAVCRRLGMRPHGMTRQYYDTECALYVIEAPTPSV